MPGGSTTNTNQSQQSQTSPWAPAQPMLQSILNGLGQQSTGPTSAQTSAANTLQTEAGQIPDMGPAATTAVNNALGTNTSGAQGLLSSSLGTLQSQLNPIATASLNPMDTPGFSNALGTMNQDITNQVNDQFAAAGRDLSPGNSQALARGISQGDSAAIAGQYNQNVANASNAANSLFGAGSTTASGLTAQQLAQEQAQLSGVGASTALPGIFTQPGATQLGAATTSAQLPLSTLQSLEGLTVPIAGLGGQSSGTSTGTQTTQTSPISSILGGALGGAGLLGQTGAFGSTGWLSGLGSIFSDERVKDDIAPVGELYDGQPIYSYKYKGDDTPRIGLMAQNVEKVQPDAVTEIGGIKAVNYGKATERARAIGMLNDMALAA
jgi:hypothetical protein